MAPVIKHSHTQAKTAINLQHPTLPHDTYTQHIINLSFQTNVFASPCHALLSLLCRLLARLQESLHKRNPDSVSNLIRAATVSETVQEERRQHAQVSHLTALSLCTPF